MAPKEPTKKKTVKKNQVGKPLKFPHLDELKANIEAYFAWCNPHVEYVNQPVLMKDGTYKLVDVPRLTYQRPYTISGLAYFLDTTRSTLLDYENLIKTDPKQLPLKLRAKNKSVIREYSYTIKRAKARCEGYVEEQLLVSRNAVGAIFNLKNNYGNWKDQTEVVNPEETENRKAIEDLRDILRSRIHAVKRKKI